MSNLLVGGIIASVIVIVIGVLYTLPPYVKTIESKQHVPSILLSLSIISDQNMPQWCQNVAILLNNTKLKAAVFFSGAVAEEHAECVRAFNDNVDIGSSTYSFTKLSAERDYLEQLEDIRRGKATVDSVAGIDSKLFKAPYGYTDENIYSLLSRNNITVDLSGNNSYNKYEGTYFILHNLKTFDLGVSSVDEIESAVADKVSDQVQIVADNSVPVEKIKLLVSTILQKNGPILVNASDVTAMNLMEEVGK